MGHARGAGIAACAASPLQQPQVPGSPSVGVSMRLRGCSRSGVRDRCHYRAANKSPRRRSACLWWVSSSRTEPDLTGPLGRGHEIARSSAATARLPPSRDVVAALPKAIGRFDEPFRQRRANRDLGAPCDSIFWSGRSGEYHSRSRSPRTKLGTHIGLVRRGAGGCSVPRPILSSFNNYPPLSFYALGLAQEGLRRCALCQPSAV